MLTVRKLTCEELDEASRVLWKSYYAAERDETSLEGMTTFRDLTAPLSLKMNAVSGENLFFGAFDEKGLIGVGAVKNACHVLLLYVLPEEQGKGVGSALLNQLLHMAKAESVTVNAAPGAVPFYEKKGFRAKSPLTVKDGIRFIPMVMKR